MRLQEDVTGAADANLHVPWMPSGAAGDLILLILISAILAEPVLLYAQQGLSNPIEI